MMEKTTTTPPFPTAEAFEKLATLLRAAYLEECLDGTCQCITEEEHERNLARAKALLSA